MQRFATLALLLLSLLASPAANAQQQAVPTAPGEILQGLQRLNTVGAVLYIAAHPDDENTRLLGYLANERKLRTGYLSLTRGDGGQNLIGKDQGEALGLIRTQELLAARRVDGAEQFFTRANDFGYSKNPEETFSIWNRDSVLADVVWTIRRFRPDVIVCRFPTTGEGGHGHHTASALLAVEAFSAAADPSRFPQQLAYTSVWQPRRIFWNTFNFGSVNTTSPDQVKMDVGGFNALVGKSYGEIAAESRSNHKSQGFGSARSRGEALEYFKQLKGDSAKSDLFEGINQSWTRFPATAKLAPVIAEAAKKFNPMQPSASVPALSNIYRQLKAIDSKDAGVLYWKQQKMKETETLLLACAGLWLEASTTDFAGIPGNEVTINAQVINRNGGAVTLRKIGYPQTSDSATNLALKPNTFYSFAHKEVLDAAAAYSNPYWLTEKHAVATYVVKDPLLIGKPENDFGQKVIFELSIGDLQLDVARPLLYKATDPVKGEVYRPFEVLPPLTIALADKVLVFNDGAPRKLAVTIKANAANTSGKLEVSVPAGWIVSIDNADILLANKNEETTRNITITRGANSVNGKLSVAVNSNGVYYTKSIRRLEFDHIPYQFFLNDADATLVNVDLKKTGTNIGYIPGAGDDVPASLMQIGYTVTMLNDELLATADLSKYDAIVSGVRAYNINEHLPQYHSRLMDYVKNGGNLIVQYNTNSRVGPLLTKIGPWPFTVTNKRVTDENAAITITNPTHPALNVPNKITNADFSNWVQERGIYFAGDIDKQYETLLAMNDVNEAPLDGSLIIGKYGKGNFVYTGLVFFRQLPAGNPGAYRLFANLLSLPQNK